MGEGEGGGEAWARPPSRSRLPPHPDRSPRLRRRRGASLTAPLPPPGGKERQACTKIYVPVLSIRDPQVGDEVCRALGQEVNDVVIFSIDQDRAVALPASPVPRIHAPHLGGGRRRR